MNFEEVTERRLNDHAERLRVLEISDAKKNEKIDSLCEKLEILSNSIKELMDFMKSIIWKALGGAGALLVIFLSFFMWYIQSLPR